MKNATQCRLSNSYTILDGEDFLKTYEFGKKELGRSNARVFEAKNKHDLSKAAIKEIRLADESDTSAVLKEISLLKSIQGKDNNNYFIKFLNFCIIREDLDRFNSTTTAYILMEKGAYSLTKLIESRKKNPYTYNYFSLDEVQKMFRFLIDAFAFLQNDLILAHCDIKPENLLIMKEHELDFKVCDVGAGEILMNDQHTKTKTIKGTIPFQAPEICGQMGRKKMNMFKADVFSLGLCFLYIITFKKFSKADRQSLSIEILQEILNEWINEAFIILNSEDIRFLLKDMLEIDPSVRPDFKELQEKYLTISLKSPTISEDTNNKTMFTLNDDNLTNSFVQQTDDMSNSPDRKRKNVLIKKKTGNERFKSLHQFPIENNSNFKEVKPQNKPQELPKELKLFIDDPAMMTTRTPAKSIPNFNSQKGLSPVKVFKSPGKKMSSEEEEDVISPGSETKKQKKNINNYSSHKSFTIHLKESKDSEEGKSPDNIKKSMFGKKNSTGMANVKIENGSPTKKTHLKIQSNASELLKKNNINMNSQYFVSNENQNQFSSMMIQRNDASHFISNKDLHFFSKEHKGVEPAFFSNKDPNFQNTREISEFPQTEAHKIKQETFHFGINKDFYSNYKDNESNTFKQENFHPGIGVQTGNKDLHSPTREIPQFNIKEIKEAYFNKEFMTNNKDTLKKKVLVKNLPPLNLVDSSFNRTNNSSLINLTPITTVATDETLQNRTNRKDFEFLEISKRTLITGKASLERFLRKIRKDPMIERKINLVLEHKYPEKDIAYLFNLLTSITDLVSLTIDLYFSQYVGQSMINFLTTCSEVSSLVINYKELEKKANNQTTACSISLPNLNKALLSIEKVQEITLNFDKLSEMTGNVSSLFLNISSLIELSTLHLSLKSLNLNNGDLINLLKHIQKIESLETLELFLENNLIDESLFLVELTFPPELKKLTLCLAFNHQMDLSESKNIVSLILPGSLDSFTFDFEGNPGGNILSHLKESIKMVPHLKYLNLNLADSKPLSQGLADLTVSLSKLNHLESLFLNLKGNTCISDVSIANLCKTIRSNFTDLRCLELNLLYIDLSWNTVKGFFNFGNYMSCLKLEFFNLFLFRNTTQKTVREHINSSNRDYKFDLCIVYPDLKEMKVLTRIHREKKEQFGLNKQICSFMQCNSFPTFQQTFACLQCFGMKFLLDNTLCAFCVRECHFNHKVFYLGERKSICACFMAGTCKCSFEEECCSSRVLEGEKLQPIH